MGWIPIEAKGLTNTAIISLAPDFLAVSRIDAVRVTLNSTLGGNNKAAAGAANRLPACPGSSSVLAVNSRLPKLKSTLHDLTLDG
jgi:hypothetical protein